MITVAVVGHTARQDAAENLADRVGGRLFLDDGSLGEWPNHERAWRWCSTVEQRWSLVLQDDAQPVDDLRTHLDRGLSFLPYEGIVSLYLGTGYPRRWQPPIRTTLAAAGDAAWLRSRHLFHGVAVAMPTAMIKPMLKTVASFRRLPYDERVSAWAKASRIPVWYPIPSLVDHADGPTLVTHRDGRPRTAERRAWSFGVPSWTRSYVRLP